MGESAGDVVVKLRRGGLDLYANIRPARNYPGGVKAVRDGVDLVIVRENTEDVYVRAEYMINDDTAVALRVITRRLANALPGWPSIWRGLGAGGSPLCIRPMY